MCARVRLPGRFARNRNQRVPTGRKSVDKRAIIFDTDRRERVIQLIASQVTQTQLGGTVGEKAVIFIDTLLRSDEEVVPGQIRRFRLSGLSKDKAMHAEFEEAWKKRKEARTAVRGAVAGGSAFRALWKACR